DSPRRFICLAYLSARNTSSLPDIACFDLTREGRFFQSYSFPAEYWEDQKAEPTSFREAKDLVPHLEAGNPEAPLHPVN
ncbi:MAG: hypothetical protein ACLFTO_05350, partial [Candidatus Acetothermia bacterium]